MAVDASALVLVQPSDTIDSIATKVRSTGAATVQLLVPDNTPALQARADFAQLRRALERDRVNLLVISSDDRTLSAARLNQIDTMGVQGARVTLPPSHLDQASPYATQVLQPEARPSIDSQDAAFLEALDQVPAQERYANLDDADLYAALDDLSETLQQSAPPPRRPLTADEEFAAALDDWSDFGADERSSRYAPPPSDSASDIDSPRPQRRVRPEDIDLSSSERASPRERRRTTPELPPRRDSERTPPGGRRRPRDDRRMLDQEDVGAYAQPRAPSRMLLLIVLAAVLLLAVLAVLWYNSNRATIQIAPPAPVARTQEYKDEILPMVPVGQMPAAGAAQAQTAGAVEAQAVEADAEFSIQGQVITETLTPVSKAAGQITIYNRLSQAVELAQGTEFVAKNAQGQEVRFALDVPATVPASVTSTSVTGTSTTNGTIVVAVTARSPGAASNVGENTITQMVRPGETPENVTGESTFIVQHAPIGGGTDQPQRIVSPEAVQAALPEALTGLLASGVQTLGAQLGDQKLGIDANTVIPNREDLSAPESYEQVVEPAIGQPVPADNPTFRLTVKAHFRGLAVAPGRDVGNQLGEVVKTHFGQKFGNNLPCSSKEIKFDVTRFRWDGSKLTADVVVTCTPSGQLTEELLSKVRSAVRDQSYDSAKASLEQLKEQGLIGGFQLPERAQFPSQDVLLQIEQIAITPNTQPTDPATPPTVQPGAGP